MPAARARAHALSLSIVLLAAGCARWHLRDAPDAGGPSARDAARSIDAALAPDAASRCPGSTAYFEPGCASEGEVRIEPGCYEPCTGLDDHHCTGGTICRHTVVNPCLCEPGLACCEACGAEQWLCLPPDPSGACAGRSYCDCTGDCAPLVDLTPGCICPCDDPFHCGGPACDCDCGGAHYLGCAIVGVCPSTEIQCAPGLHAEIIGGCPTCVIAH